jgi:hypothetical protein
MSEQDLIELGFSKQVVLVKESGNEYDYYYYTLDLMEGIAFYSSSNDEIIDGNVFIKSFEVPNMHITSRYDFENLLEVLKNCTNVLR